MTTSAQRLPTQREGSTFAYVVLLAVGAVDAAGYSIIAPVTPAIARSTGAGPGLIGVVVASFALGSVVASVLAAVGVKRGRTTRVLMISLTMAALGSLGFVFGDGLIVYFASRFLMGMGAGGVWMGITFNVLERYPGQEYLCMSRVFAAYAVGGLLGPVLGSLGGIARPFIAYFVLVLVAGVLVAVMGESHSTRSFDTDRSALRLPGVLVGFGRPPLRRDRPRDGGRGSAASLRFAAVATRDRHVLRRDGRRRGHLVCTRRTVPPQVRPCGRARTDHRSASRWREQLATSRHGSRRWP